MAYADLNAEQLPELTAEEIEAISPPSLYLTALKRIVQLEERHAVLVEAARAVVDSEFKDYIDMSINSDPHAVDALRKALENEDGR